MPAMLLTACSDEDENTDGGSTMPPTQDKQKNRKKWTFIFPCKK